MARRYETVGFFLIVFAIVAPAVTAQVPDRHALWYDVPAVEWTEALPVGNGRLGAMVFGRSGQERIQLNEETMWAGHPIDRDLEGAYQYLDEVRQLIFDGQYQEAEVLVGEHVLAERLIRSYQTLGDLHLTFEDTSDAVTDYRRSLSLDSALRRTTYRRGDARIMQEVFASHLEFDAHLYQALQ